MIVPTWRIDYPSLENKLSTYGVCKVQGVIGIYITTISEDFFEEYRFYLEKTRIGNRNPESLPLLVDQVDIPCRAVSHRITRCNPFENTQVWESRKDDMLPPKGWFRHDEFNCRYSHREHCQIDRLIAKQSAKGTFDRGSDHITDYWISFLFHRYYPTT